MLLPKAHDLSGFAHVVNYQISNLSSQDGQCLHSVMPHPRTLGRKPGQSSQFTFNGSTKVFLIGSREKKIKLREKCLERPW
jgi:hypothetical protein